MAKIKQNREIKMHEHKLLLKNIFYFLFLCIFAGFIFLSIYGIYHFEQKLNKLGNEYYYLAYHSLDIENTIFYLEKYREAIKENGFDKGNAGLVFKTVDKDMSNRYAKLVQGINLLKRVKENRKLLVTDLDIYLKIQDYVGSLNVSIDEYLTANNGWYCFLYIHSIWISILMFSSYVFIAWQVIFYYMF